MGRAVKITGKTIGIGHQDFEQVIKNNIFYSLAALILGKNNQKKPTPKGFIMALCLGL